MPRPNLGRERVSFYAKAAAVAEVDAAAATEGVIRSEMLRRLLGLGLAVWQQHGAADDGTPPAGLSSRPRPGSSTVLTDEGAGTRPN